MSVPRLEVDALRVPGIRHGFFGRQGGVSSGIYASLNCGQGSGDAADAVAENRRRVLATLAPGRPLVTPWQVHGSVALSVTEPWATDGDRPRADAVVTATPGLVLGVLTADCAPILFVDPEARVIGAAHAGWRGALAGIVESTVAAMVGLGARRDRLRAAVGPCLSQPNYQIGPEFKASFLAASPYHDRYFQRVPDGSDHFDLPRFVADRLHEAQIAHVIECKICTYANADTYYSFRLSTQRNAADYGRQISAIVAE